MDCNRSEKKCGQNYRYFCYDNHIILIRRKIWIVNELAQYIDHTALTAEKTEQDILKLLMKPIQYGFYSVCINSGYIPFSQRKTRWLRCKNCTVVVFHSVPTYPQSKPFETPRSHQSGCG